ncbi:MAG: PBP1A family penicillin-binding protein [Candidatus Parcubacteria bacterium]|nr:PBP1A family penicillin-binding protein [Candidatus Parcubacteria bacterium]
MFSKIYHHKTYNENSSLKRFLKRIGLFFLFSIIILVFIGLSVFIYIAKDLPRPEVFTERAQIMPTRIYDRTGETLLRTIYGEEKRELVALSDVPDPLIKAVLAAEDDNFYNHHGVDLKGVIRAILVDFRLKQPAQGASTITQQLIRSTFLSSEKSATRKIRELVLTLELERRYSKNQILEWYLNQIPFGPNIYGVGEASRTFFGKSVKDITLPEAAVIAAMIQAPSYYYPYGEHQDALLKRKDFVLGRMLEEKYISEDVYNEAKKTIITFSDLDFAFNDAPHFILYVENYLYQKYGGNFLKEHGLKVYTTLDLKLQKEAETAVEQGSKNNEAYQAFNAALVAINPNNGEIMAMVGSKNYFGEPYPKGCTPGLDCKFEPKVNVVTYGLGQQPGSAFKPFAYATAFKKGYTPDNIVVDEKTNFGKWGNQDYIPENYDGLYRGPVTLRQALAQSLNIPSIKVLLAAGIADTIATAHDMGITTLNESPSFYGPSLVLGAGEVKLIDMVSAYGVFAYNGLRVPPTAILKIEDEEGNIIEENTKTPRRVLSEDICKMITSILSDNVARTPMFGANSALYFPGYEVAAKTGTTDQYRDTWTIGYTPSLAVGVWAGNNDNSPMANRPSITIAGPIWHNFFAKALTGQY